MNLLRAMGSADIESAIDIIHSHDEDDAEEARLSYNANGGLDDQYVLEIDGRVIGVTGYATPPGCDRVHWLSWTYVHEASCNQGHGRRMLEDLVQRLTSLDARKLFVKISDYKEENDEGNLECIYDAAMHLYKSMGFTAEIVLKDYYDEHESMTILGKQLAPPNAEPAVYTHQKQKIQFNSIFEIAETDDAYSFGWTEKGKKAFDIKDVELGIEEVRKKDGRAVFLSFPHTYEGIADTLYAAGFSNAGVLEDYFEDGLHEQHFSCYL